jgi:hypothetical protein
MCLDGGNSAPLEVFRLEDVAVTTHLSRLRTSAGIPPASPLGQYYLVLRVHGITGLASDPRVPDRSSRVAIASR